MYYSIHGQSYISISSDHTVPCSSSLSHVFHIKFWFCPLFLFHLPLISLHPSWSGPGPANSAHVWRGSHCSTGCICCFPHWEKYSHIWRKYSFYEHNSELSFILHVLYLYSFIPIYIIWMCVHVPSHCLRDPGQSGSRKLPVIPNTLGSEEKIWNRYSVVVSIGCRIYSGYYYFLDIFFLEQFYIPNTCIDIWGLTTCIAAMH